jgi:arylformamidase
MTRLIDLSFPLAHGQLTFAWDPKLSVVVHNTVSTVGYNITQISLSTHQGTHCDAPFHFFDDGKTIDRIPLERCYGPATLVDLAPAACLAPKTPITVDMLRPFEEQFQPGAKILYRTGWDRRFNQADYFRDFPTLTLEAARWIAARRIGLLGMDTPTPSADWLECHHVLLAPEVEVMLVEGLTRLEQLPANFTFIGFPLNITGRDGAPLRAVAVVD